MDEDVGGSFARVTSMPGSPMNALLGAKAKVRSVSFKSASLINWPPEVNYTNTPDLTELSAADKRAIRLDYLPGVRIQSIADPAHPACGQRGLFAARAFAPGEVLGEYTGKVMPGECGGDYVTRLWDTGDDSDYWKPGVDAEHMGNELRMCNDYRGVPGAEGPNCRFSRTMLRGYRAVLVVTIKDITEGAEILLDYGEHYWRPATDRLRKEEDGEGGMEERTVSAVLPEDLKALEDDLVEMNLAAQDTK